MEHAEFDAAFKAMPEGYAEGAYEGRRFGVTVKRSEDGRRNSLQIRRHSSPAKCPPKRSWHSCWGFVLTPDGR